MEFNNIPPKWDATGAEPSADLQTSGFKAGYKPPAAYFNYLFNKITACLKELQEKLKGHAEDKTNPHGVTATQVKAVPLDGGKPMTGDLVIEKNYPFVRLNHLSGNSGVVYGSHNNIARIMSQNTFNDEENMRTLELYNAEGKNGIADALCIVDIVNNIHSTYKIYGEHNISIMPFLPLTGGTMVGSGLGMRNGKAKITAGDEFVQLESYKDTAGDTDNRRLLALKNSNNIASALQLVDWTSGTSKYYSVYGEHNSTEFSFTEHGVTFSGVRIGKVVVLHTSGKLDYGISDENKVKTFSNTIPEGFRPKSTTHCNCMSITSKDTNGNRITNMFDLGIGGSGTVQVQVEIKNSAGESITASNSSGMSLNMSMSYIAA